MNVIWNRIKKWIEQQSDTASFEVGASDEDISKAESIVGKLPSDVRESYRIHNGTNLIWITDDGYLMPLFVPTQVSRRKQSQFNAVVKRWTLFKELLDSGGFEGAGFSSDPAGPIKTDHWNARWIPITDNKCGDHLCIDMAPGKGGKKGQIIQWDHEVGAKRVVASSMSAWLEKIADDMESGQYTFDSKAGAVIRKA